MLQLNKYVYKINTYGRDYNNENQNNSEEETQKIKKLENELNTLNVSRDHQQQEIIRLQSELEKAKGIISSHELANGKLNNQVFIFFSLLFPFLLLKTI